MSASVLLIHNHPASLELIGGLLKMFGYTLLTASGVDSGLAKARGEKPDVIICSIQLPANSGYELARQVKADPDLGSIPLVALAALGITRDRGKALKAGFDAYVAQPLDPDSLVAEVAALLPPGVGSGSPGAPVPAFSRVWWKA